MNSENKFVITSTKDKSQKRNKSPFVREKVNDDDLEESNFIGSSNQYFHEVSNDRDKNYFPGTGKRAQYTQKFNNNSNNYGFSDNSYVFPLGNRDISVLTESNIFDNSSTNTNSNNTVNNNIKTNARNKGNITLHEIKTSKTDKNNYKNMNYSANISNSFMTNNNSILNNNNIAYTNNVEPYDSKYSFKINKIKDDYIDFLQKEFEDNSKNNAKLDSNNKELLKKCEDLMHDNRLLTNTLNERTTKLNKIIQENLCVKSELDKSNLNNQKNEQKIAFYEEQLNLYKTNNDNYQKIIKELKEQNDQLNISLSQMERAQEENQKITEEKLREEIENTRKNMEELYTGKRKDENEKIEKKAQVFIEQIKLLQEKNEELINELTNKENMFDLVCKENEKLTNENNLYRNQVDQYTNQINELNTIIKHKDGIINNLKSDNINTDKFLNKSNSYSMMKFDGSEYINENISKLITDNEENKMRIELLNDKIRSIDEIEKKYNELMNGKRTLTLSEKLALHMNDPNPNAKNISTHFNYNGLNNIKNTTYQSSASKYKNMQNIMSPTKLQNHIGELNDILNSPDLIMKFDKNNTYKKDNYLSLTNNLISKNKNNVFVSSSSITSNSKRIEDRQKKLNESIAKSIEHKNNVDREIKVKSKNQKIVSEKLIPKINKSEGQDLTPTKGRYYRKGNQELSNSNIEEKKNNIHGKEIDTEKDEVKESLREMNRKKNYTHKPKINNYPLEEKDTEQKNNDNENNIMVIEESVEEEKKKPSKEYFLYGIDRNDCFHIFNINEKKWEDTRNISDLELDDKSTTFKKDYQYEGTLLYNTLEGVYILTGAKTDTLYYFNSLTNKITKICKFNTSHDNGSIMFDRISNCLYVFGGKKITSCEYYSLNDKQVYKLPDLIYDRANASFIVSNNKIYGFFGFSYSKDTYAKTIEYMDYIKKDKWVELTNIEFLKDDINFDTESVSTMYYRQNQNQILIYCGIQGDEEDFVTEYYLLYDSRNNTMDKIDKWDMQQYKNMGKKWKNYNFKKNDPKGFHFAKNSRFLLLPKNGSYEGYNEKDPIDILIDYKNNVHYIQQDKEKIDIYRSDM